MRVRSDFDPDGNLWDLIAFELRRQRQERDLSLAAIGDIIDRDRSLVAYVECGKTKLQAAHAEKIDRAWGTGGLFRRLVKFAKSGHDVEWFEFHCGLEMKASEVRMWELGWIPGLFQIEDYARAIFEASGVEDVEEGAKLRVQRQVCRHRTPRPRVWALIAEQAITKSVSSPALMRRQIAHLIELAGRPNITIRVVLDSVGAHVGRDGSFKIMTVDGVDSVYTFAPGGGRLIQDAIETRPYRVWFDLIGDVALPKDASLGLLRELMERCE